MSSRSPSTVNSAVRRIALGLTRRPRQSSSPLARQMFLEHPLHGLEIELRRHVEHGEILVVEVLDGRWPARCSPLASRLVQIDLRLDVPLGVHAHEGGELQEAGIDPPRRAGIAQRHAAIRLLLEPVDRLAGRELVDLGRVDARVDRARHQGHAARLAGMVVLGHQRGRRQRLHAGLADGDHVRARPHRLEERDQVLDIFVEAEAAVPDADVARIGPVGDVDVVLGQQHAHRVAQQGGEVAGQRRHQQHRAAAAARLP